LSLLKKEGKSLKYPPTFFFRIGILCKYPLINFYSCHLKVTSTFHKRLNKILPPRIDNESKNNILGVGVSLAITAVFAVAPIANEMAYAKGANGANGGNAFASTTTSSATAGPGPGGNGGNGGTHLSGGGGGGAATAVQTGTGSSAFAGPGGGGGGGGNAD
jgi:hypothetical protein